MSISKYHVSKNLFDKSSQTIGCFVRAGNITPEKPLGNIENAAGYNLSAYIAVQPNTIYTIKYPVASIVGGAGIVYYSDNSGTTISGVPLGDQGQTYTFTTPNNCTYIRFSYDNTEGTDVMLNKGSTSLPYEPYGNTWQSIPYRKRETATDTITTLPADVIADGQSASAVIKGNLSQSGTPTPTSPIYPTETGDKTANLCNSITFEKGRIDNGVVGYTSQTTELTTTINEITFTTNAQYRGVCSDFIEIPDGATELSFSGVFSGANGIGKKFVFYDTQKTWLNADYTVSITIDEETTQIPNNAKYVRLSMTAQSAATAKIKKLMLNTGSTPLSYEPYGYKIPILCGNTTTNVHLGEVQSTRQIKKLVLTGEETGWNTNGSGDNKFFYFPVVNETVSGTTAFCNQYTQENIGSSTTDVGIGFAGTTQFRIRPNNPSQYTALSDFTNYVKGLYQSGTPIIIWYVLATPTTTTLNEPIRKIGNYADSVSVTGIPTTGTAESFDVDTTLKPSEVQLTYHGWHEHNDTKF